MAGLALVVDSTAYLPAGFAERYGIRVVPVQVVIGGVATDESSSDPSELARALRNWEPVTTARPSPSLMLAAYDAARDAGADAVVSIHLSSALSGTFESAQLAAKDADIPVRCVDSGSIGMVLGFAAAAAAEAAAGGATVEEAAVAAEQVCAGSQVLFVVSTLEYLRRGGRIGPAAAFVGGALSIKPILHLVDGVVEPLEKVRTLGRAMNRLEELAVTGIQGRSVKVAVHHLDAADRAQQLAKRLSDRTGIEVPVTEIGAVVGAHVGPGMVAVVVSPAPQPS